MGFIKNFKSLEDWEQSQLLSSMQRIAAMMDAENLDASPVLELEPMHLSAEPLTNKRDAPNKAT